MRFSRRMWLIIIQKVTKKQGFTLSLQDTPLEKTLRGGDHFLFTSLLKAKNQVNVSSVK